MFFLMFGALVGVGFVLGAAIHVAAQIPEADEADWISEFRAAPAPDSACIGELMLARSLVIIR